MPPEGSRATAIMDGMAGSSQGPKGAVNPLGLPGPRRLIWPVKESLVAYLAALPDAVLSGPHFEGGFTLEASCEEAGTIRSRGTIRLTAHEGQLDIVLRDLEVSRGSIAVAELDRMTQENAAMGSSHPVRWRSNGPAMLLF